MGKQTGCYADSIAANPNRPTVANPADITQYGVLELEYGFDRIWPRAGVRQTSLGGLLKLAVLCDLEFRWTTTSYLSQSDSAGTHRTFGDNWFGPQVRFYHQNKHVPTLSFSYAVKIPSAGTKDGLGSGFVDHDFTFLASKDIGKVHLRLQRYRVPCWIRRRLRQEPATQSGVLACHPRPAAIHR